MQRAGSCGEDPDARERLRPGEGSKEDETELDADTMDIIWANSGCERIGSLMC